ncbi:MAG: hypothetical protein HZA72_02555, partial [Candidatus Omnitrophica bacterium]|nr:hypothetical protein [Candidatus Omnitrophota bacterium]
IPILIIIGLCVFSYKVGELIGNAKGHGGVKKFAKAQELEEENKRLKEEIENKCKELEAQNKLIDSVFKENKELLKTSHKEFLKKVDGQREDLLKVIVLKKRIAQLEDELKKK